MGLVYFLTVIKNQQIRKNHEKKKAALNDQANMRSIEASLLPSKYKTENLTSSRRREMNSRKLRHQPTMVMQSKNQPTIVWQESSTTSACTESQEVINRRDTLV